MRFESHGRQYEIDELGVINQIDAEPFVYDAKYVSTYDTEAYRRQSDILQALRLGFVIAAHGKTPQKLLDWGYGNGAFMKFASQQIRNVYGYDVTGIQVEGCTVFDNQMITRDDYDVITFWDALEHIPDLDFLSTLWRTKTIVISLPYCHLFALGQKWFDEKYKHRKPDEHLHHFTPTSLANLMEKYGWVKVASSTHEDIVRVSTYGEGIYKLPNIITMAFKQH